MRHVRVVLAVAALVSFTVALLRGHNTAALPPARHGTRQYSAQTWHPPAQSTAKSRSRAKAKAKAKAKAAATEAKEKRGEENPVDVDDDNFAIEDLLEILETDVGERKYEYTAEVDSADDQDSPPEEGFDQENEQQNTQDEPTDQPDSAAVLPSKVGRGKRMPSASSAAPVQRQRGCTIPHPAPDLDWENGKTDDSFYNTTAVQQGALARGETHSGQEADFQYNVKESAACAVPFFSKLVPLKKGRLGLYVDCSKADNGHSPAMFVGAGDLPISGGDYDDLVIVGHKGKRKTTFVVPPDAPMVSALCSTQETEHGRNEGAKWNLRNPWPTLRVSDKVAARAKRKRNAAKKDQPIGALGGMNVVVAFFDAIARTQWERAMKQTNDLLDRWSKEDKTLVFDFEKFHVDGWNTDDNIVPQWYGHTLHQVTADDDGKTDNQCRAGVWPLFSRRGYITANLASVVDFYGLDGTTQCSPDAEITEYMHKSYYEGKLSANQGWRGRRRNLNVYDISCVQSYRHNLRAAVNLLHQFRGTGTPVFTTAYIEDAHDSMSAKMLPLMDAGTRTALLDFEPHLDNTVLLLISDHGLHYGKHVESFAGQVEHKLPVFKMLLPPKLATTHPKLIEVLRENQHTLVHHWDVYETLRSLTFYPDTAPTDFGQFNSKDEATEHQPQVGLSLLEPIASSRTCTDAGIPDEVCVCGNEAEVPLSEADANRLDKEVDKAELQFIQTAIGQALARINSMADKSDGVCSQVKLGEIEGAFTKDFSAGKNWGAVIKKGSSYRFVFSVVPANGSDGVRRVYQSNHWRRGIGSYEWAGGFTGDSDLVLLVRTSEMTSTESKCAAKKKARKNYNEQLRNGLDPALCVLQVSDSSC